MPDSITKKQKGIIYNIAVLSKHIAGRFDCVSASYIYGFNRYSAALHFLLPY